MTRKALEYEPDQIPLGMAVRDIDAGLRDKLTDKATVEDIADRIKKSAFTFDPDDAMTLVSASELQVVDEDEYVRGYELLAELGDIEDRITTHYSRFDKPLNFLIGIVRSLRIPQSNEITPVKKALSTRLGAYKQKKNEEAHVAAERKQAAEDAAARAARDARADALERVAKAEPNPALAQSFLHEAESVRASDVHAAPVDVQPDIPSVPGYTRQYWACEFVDVKELMRAYVEGRCFLDEEAIKAGLQSSLDEQAGSLTKNMSKAFPGTRAIYRTAAIARRKR